MVACNLNGVMHQCSEQSDLFPVFLKPIMLLEIEIQKFYQWSYWWKHCFYLKLLDGTTSEIPLENAVGEFFLVSSKFRCSSLSW